MLSSSSTSTPRVRRSWLTPRWQFALAFIGSTLVAPMVLSGRAGRAASALIPSSLCYTAQSVISPSDISYVGAIRMPQNGVDTSGSYGGLTGRIVDGQVHLFVYGIHRLNLSQSDFVYELGDPGAGYNPDYTAAPRATLIKDWGDIYHGKRQTWESNGSAVDLSTWQIPDGLYWNEQTQLLYWTYFDTYNTTARPDWGLGATSLDLASGTSTAYGPWRTKAVDADGRAFYGPWRCRYLLNNPSNNSMLCGSGQTSGVHTTPWGPDLYGGRPWPTAATPSGFGSPDLNLPDRLLEYYFMGNQQSANYVDNQGKVHGNLRAFRRTVNKPVFEPFPSNYQNLTVNPALNNGVGSWTDMDFTTGGIWLNLTNKRGVIFSAALSGSAVQDPTSPLAGHVWYRNSGLGHDTCTHGISSPVPITGPVSTASFPALIIYNPDDLLAVKGGQMQDYRVDPVAVLDLEQAFNIKTAPITVVGAAKSVRGFYFDPVRKYLFVLANRADDTRAGPVFLESLIHVFRIND